MLEPELVMANLHGVLASYFTDSTCYRLNVCALPPTTNKQFHTLKPNPFVMVSGGGASGVFILGLVPL